MLKEEKISEINRQFRLTVNEFNIDEEDLLIGYVISRYMYKKCILQKEDLTQDRNLKLMVNFIDCARGIVMCKEKGYFNCYGPRDFFNSYGGVL